MPDSMTVLISAWRRLTATFASFMRRRWRMVIHTDSGTSSSSTSVSCQQIGAMSASAPPSVTTAVSRYSGVVRQLRDGKQVARHAAHEHACAVLVKEAETHCLQVLKQRLTHIRLDEHAAAVTDDGHGVLEHGLEQVGRQQRRHDGEKRPVQPQRQQAQHRLARHVGKRQTAAHRAARRAYRARTAAGAAGNRSKTAAVGGRNHSNAWNRSPSETVYPLRRCVSSRGFGIDPPPET